MCCDKADRLTRDFIIGFPKIEKLRKEGKIELHFPSDNLVLHQNSPATDLFHFNIAVSLAQYYSNAISDNTRRALEQKLRNGEWIGQARVGYLNITHENEEKDLILDPKRAHLIQKLFELYASDGYSIKTLRDETYKLGLRSRNEKKMPPSMIHKTLKDKFYIGTMTSKGREYPHKYPTIISKDLFDKVQDVLSGRQKKSTKYAVKPFILRITQDVYDRKMKEYKEKQYSINQQIEEYTQADENYHIIASTVFSLASRAREIFECSEVNEKRQLLNLILQNCRLSGRKLVFEVRSPFNTILETAHQPLGLRGPDSNRQPIG